MNQTSVFIGIDMGATHTRLCAIDKEKNIKVLKKYKTDAIVADDVVNGLISVVKHELEEHNLKVARLLIGLPATISKDRTSVLSTPNLCVEQSDFNRLVPTLKHEFDCKVELERDVNLQIAYDTHHLHVEDKIVLGCYLGSGFGFSIWFHGDVYTGAHGVAGELGHIPYGRNGVRCGCGNSGCLESLVSGVVLKAEYDSQNADYEIKDFFSQQCNATFTGLFVEHTAKAIATSVNLFDPDIVLLGGGVMDMEGFPFGKLRQLIFEHVRKPLPSEELTLMKATSSSFNGATGAALQALNRS
ncbi:allose kinase [Vibrio panuliri]|uniref:Allose kinase n=1 Tax=Vibrio panuliri TaxID=1381081 RepID=A0ABX3FD75_9VIBR|nr:allose kinase [Vibrio panuliri]KAB1457133.1 allose kinase [Vibrio panuliri]OLQ87624.1 hypothetical protein BIY20_13445 [Vibrio panuliri]